MEKADLDVHHVKYSPKVEAVAWLAEHYHVDAVCVTCKTLCFGNIPRQQVAPDDSHAEEKEDSCTSRKLYEWFERVVADTAIRKTAVVIHHEDAFLTH